MLIQLAGDLRGRVLQEWNLITKDEKNTAVSALRSQIDPGNTVLAAQDFTHAVQDHSEPVSDYIRRVEWLFKMAYSQDGMSTETREALFYSQSQEGLKYSLMKSPAVSGAQSYRQLCTSAKLEEKRLVELNRHQQYQHKPESAEGTGYTAVSGAHQNC